MFAKEPAFHERDLMERYKVGLEVLELSDLLLVHLREICIDLEKALPQDADRLRGEHDKYYAQKIPELDKLRRGYNLKSAFESGYAGFSSHPEIKAEEEKLSEEVQMIQQHTEKESMEYKAIEPGIRLNEEMGCYDTREDQDRHDQRQEEAEPEGHGDVATFQSKADVTCRGYKGEEVNVEVQYAGQDDPKIFNNLGQAMEIAEKEEEKLVTEGPIKEFHEIDEQKAAFKETAKQKGDQTMSTYIMAMLFWTKQSMPATKQAFQDRKLDEAVVTAGAGGPRQKTKLPTGSTTWN